MIGRKVRVLVVDDSAVVRRVLSETLSRSPDIEVVGVASDAFIARDQIVALRPDVMTLDVEMPGCDGITLLRSVMAHAPLPVIVISSITTRGSAKAMEAFEAGAFDVLAKPNTAWSVADLGNAVVERVRAAARAPSRGRSAGAVGGRLAELAASEGALIAIASSTGGTEALAALMARFPRNLPPTVIVQHIHPGFTTSFAARLDRLGGPQVREAADGETLRPGMVRLAPGEVHLVMEATPAGLRTRLRDGPRVCFQKPAADVLFHSVARLRRPRVVGVVLTGMGEDGAEGLLALRRAGGRTLVQDEASCVVYGMPRAAWERGAAEARVPLARLPEAIAQALAERAAA